MLKENAVVIAYEAGIAKVKCQSQSACGTCAAKNACGASALSELTGEVGEHIFTIETIMPLKVGQHVEIGLEERSLILSALLLYIVPLLTILLSTFIAEKLFSHELISAIFIFFCTALSFIAIRTYSKKLARKAAYKPILLRTL
ncbi:SoxR reducing system RseC family protein [Pasteurella dagmatis]|uniref:Positive regulator of sigma(E), RseC/MucC n=1 Tax=Pasteurella dagmatis ATCC 43325 TaxID=667128 RepID=C9PSF1_9PAST|nr:SoxR reducing system RseC family protein [Pasteurella dagmatis]EEX49570.1 positive regulator of sigma(E), RseC/MucC [Pasteurella dagmatis ATCC 43325]SNV83166.1 putative regulator of sigma(E), RseC/MucC family [Pasteurella dagmatis]